MTRRSTGTLKQFVVTQDLTITGAAGDVLYFQPAIYGPGSPYQNVDVLPIAATTTAIAYPAQTVTASVHGINALALHGDAFAMVGVKLETPKAVEIASQTRDPVTGLSVRFIRQFDAQTSKMVNRFDVLLGFGCLYADNCACRVLSLL